MAYQGFQFYFRKRVGIKGHFFEVWKKLIDGSKYERTRHNAGFMVIDRLSSAWNIPLIEEKKFKGEMGRGIVKGEKVILLKPTTFMNLSGESVRALIDFYDIDVEDIIVIYDDLDLPLSLIHI